MKIISFFNNSNFVIRTDNSIIKDEIPFVKPFFIEDIYFRLDFLIKIDKSGKFIQYDYLKKYYSSMAIGLNFLCSNDIDNVIRNNSLYNCFDGGYKHSKFYNLDLSDTTIENLLLKFNNSNTNIININNNKNISFYIENINKAICYVSKFITLKKGDIISIQLYDSIIKLEKEHNNISINNVNNKLLLDLNILH